MLPRSVGLIHLLPTELKLSKVQKNACIGALLGFGLDVERDGDLPREREHPDRYADREGDVRCAAEEGTGGRHGGGPCRLWL